MLLEFYLLPSFSLYSANGLTKNSSSMGKFLIFPAFLYLQLLDFRN